MNSSFIGTERIVHCLEKYTFFLPLAETIVISLLGDYFLPNIEKLYLVEIQKYIVKIFYAISAYGHGSTTLPVSGTH
jgi:hypothetical protein